MKIDRSPFLPTFVAVLSAALFGGAAIAQTRSTTDGPALSPLDSTGVNFAEWQDTNTPGDNLGNHTAVLPLNMNAMAILAASSISASGEIRTTTRVTAAEHWSGVYFHTSDRRLKTDIAALAGLPVVTRLIPVAYRMKADGRPAMGFVAQDVAAEFPDLVATDPATGIMSVEYDQIIAPLVAAVQELEARVLTLEAEVARLRDAPRLIEAAAP